MNRNLLYKITGLLFILGAVLVNIPYTLLIVNFEYPEILRKPTSYILIQYQVGGSQLLFTWLAFAWVGIPLLFAIVMLQKIMEREDIPYLSSATVAGVIGGIAQMIGLLRWTFVVPILAKIYLDPASSTPTRESVEVIFQVLHQFGGVLLGEHIGQTFTILWMLLISLAMFRSKLFHAWLAWFGIVAAAIYVLAQTELLATVIPTFPVAAEAGLMGSVLWLLWMIALGIFLVRANDNETP